MVLACFSTGDKRYQGAALRRRATAGRGSSGAVRTASTGHARALSDRNPRAVEDLQPGKCPGHEISPICPTIKCLPYSFIAKTYPESHALYPRPSPAVPRDQGRSAEYIGRHGSFI